MSPSPQFRAIDIVQGPNAEPTQKDAQAATNHQPHGLENLLVSDVLSVLLTPLRLSGCVLVICRRVHLGPRSKTRAQVDLHNIHGPEQDNGRQQRIHVLVEHRIAEIVIVAGDENGERYEKNAQEQGDGWFLVVGEGCIEHETSRVYH